MSQTAGASASDDAIDRLDRALGKRERYIEQRQHLIDSLKDAYARNCRYGDLIAIGDAYSSFINDSAIIYYERARSAAVNNAGRTEADLKRSALLPLTGYYETAVKSFGAIDSVALPAALRPLYYESGRRLYRYLSSAYEDYEPYRRSYADKALSYQEILLDLLDRSSDDYLFNLGEYYFQLGDETRAEALLVRLTETSDDKGLLARANHHLSTIASRRGDENAYRAYLANSAVADIESATLEVRSLQELGSMLYADGDIERSYRYLSTALDNAVRCGATLRMIESSRALPIIAEAHSSQSESRRRRSYVIIAVMTALLIGLGISLRLRYRETVRLACAQQRLRIANHSKDIYISRFLQLCSIYMDKLNNFCKIAERKISAGKTDELYRMVKSGRFIEEQSADFYNVFDDAFLHLYPDFVDRVNDLLKPEYRITLANGERLNTDLRILAIKRMGIDDAASIAQILNYSLNTIYAYRNRLKSHAVDRENFEKNIMKISSQS